MSRLLVLLLLPLTIGTILLVRNGLGKPHDIMTNPVPVRYRVAHDQGPEPRPDDIHFGVEAPLLHDQSSSVGKILHQLGNAAVAGQYGIAADQKKFLAVLAGEPAADALAIDPPLLYFDEDHRPHLDRFGDRTYEPHRDQTLATLALLGIPSHFKFRAAPAQATIADLIRIVRDDFHLDDELEWSAVALACYAPTRSPWINRWGKSFSFDDIVNRLLARPYGTGTCAGSHTLTTLAILEQVDEQVPIWGDGLRDRVDEYLAGAVQRLQDHQRTTGYWTPDWPVPLADPTSERYDKDLFGETPLVLATGHHLEWTSLLPEARSLSRPARERAAAWCAMALRNATKAQIAQDFCPYSHCYRSALLHHRPQ